MLGSRKLLPEITFKLNCMLVTKNITYIYDTKYDVYLKITYIFSGKKFNDFFPLFFRILILI